MAINNSVNISTGFSPFKLMYGIEVRTPITPIIESDAPAADEFIKQMTNAIDSARANILKAQASQKTQADKHCRDHNFQVGDKVGLSTKNLNIPATHS